MGIKHAYQSATANNPSSEVSSTRWNEDHAVDVALDLPANGSAPTAPASGLKLYSKTLAGRHMLHQRAPEGCDSALQTSLFGKRVMMLYPAASSTIGSFGATPTLAGTLLHPSLTTDTLAQSIYRTICQTSSTAGNAAGIRDTATHTWRGNAAGRGGFFLHHRFCSGFSSFGSTSQFFNGLSSTTSALSADPSTMSNILGVGKDAADANWQFMRKQGGGSVVKVDLGVAYAVNQTFDLIMFCAPNGSEIFVSVLQHNFDGTFTTLLDTSYSTDIPANNQFLGRRHDVRNAANAAVVAFDMVRFYVESDY